MNSITSRPTVVLYARVSTILQQNAAAQLAELRAVGKSRGWRIVGEFTERASGADNERPKLAAAMSVLRSGKAKILAAVSLDRVTRSLAHLLQLLDTLRDYRADLVCTRDGALDTTTASGRAFLAVRGVFAQMERELDSERSREFAAIRKAQGLPNGRPQLMSADAVTRAIKLRARKEDDGTAHTWAWIAARLEEEGFGEISGATICRRVHEALRNPPRRAAS